MAVSVFKTACDPTSSGWVGSIPMHSRHDHPCPQSRMTPCNHRRAAGRTWVWVALAWVLSASSLVAQQRDSTPPRIVPAPSKPTAAETRLALLPPITPKRAFLYALALPGSSQTIFGRNRTAVGMLTIEVVCMAMIAESAASVREARTAEQDSVNVSYVDANGLPLTTPTVASGVYTHTFEHTRRAHVEDWIALMVANHLFSGADAFVTAHLWDVNAQVGLRSVDRGVGVAAEFHW